LSALLLLLLLTINANFITDQMELKLLKPFLDFSQVYSPRFC